MATVTTYICPKNGALLGASAGGAAEFEASCDGVGPSELTVDGNQVTIPLMPVNKYRLSVPIIAQADQDNLDLSEYGDTGFSYARGIDVDHNGDFRARKESLTFTFNRWPDELECAPCSWKGATVTRRNLITCTNCAFLSSVPTIPNPGEAGGSGNDLHDLSLIAEIVTTDPECVPGELLMLNWVMLIGGKIVSDQVSSLRFLTPALDGGRITAVSGGMGTERTVTVSVSGLGELTMVPTDFAEYQVGSWVYLLRDTVEAHEADRQTAFEITDTTDHIYDGDPADSYRPVPVTVNDSVNPGLIDDTDWESKTLSLVSDFAADFEFSWHTATIDAVHSGANTADVTCTDLGGALTGLPIFYHCPHTADVLDGHLAFGAGDEVIVLGEGTDFSVVGFAGRRLKTCGLVIAWALWDPDRDENQYLFYRLDGTGGSLFPVVDNEGNEISQPFFENDLGLRFNQVASINGLTGLGSDPGDTLSSVSDITTTSSSSSDCDAGPAGEPPCEGSGSTSCNASGETTSDYEYTISGGAGWEDTKNGYQNEEWQMSGTANWYDQCGNEGCTFCYRVVGDPICGSYNASMDEKLLGVGCRLWDAPDYQYTWHMRGWSTDSCECYNETTDCEDTKNYNAGQEAHFLDGTSEQMFSVSQSGAAGYYLRNNYSDWAARKFTDADGQRAVVAEELAVMYASSVSGASPYTYTWDYESRLRLYFSMDAPAGFADLSAADIEAAVYALFGTNRSDYLDGMPHQFADSGEATEFREENLYKIGLRASNAYR